MKRGLISAFLLVALTACGGSSDNSDGPEVDAHTRAADIQDKVDSVTKIEDLSEDTDSNDLLGRPNGYSAATVLYDKRADGCTDGPGVDCGAVVEQWPSEDAAQARADYIQGILTGSPALGSEYDFVNGGLILRVSGSLKPSEADEYEAAFKG
jgi:hypothetical protein